MKTGIEANAYFDRNDPVASLLRMKAHGYDCADFSLSDTADPLYSLSGAALEAETSRLKSAFAEAGIEISQVHGPWRWPPQDAAEADRAERFEKMARCLKITRLLGCDNMVIHPIMPFGCGSDRADEFHALNLDFFTRLGAVAKEENVVICLENMPMPALPFARHDQLLSFLTELDPSAFAICLDTGHSIICGVQPGTAVREIGRDLLRVLHVHDNDGKRDQHLLPGLGVIDWDDFASSLREIGFTGAVSLETSVKDGVESHQLALSRFAAHLAGKE